MEVGVNNNVHQKDWHCKCEASPNARPPATLGILKKKIPNAATEEGIHGKQSCGRFSRYSSINDRDSLELRETSSLGLNMFGYFCAF